MKKNNIFSGFAALGLLCCAAAPADDAANDRWYAAPGLGYVIADSDRNADDGAAVQFNLGKPVGESWNVELGGVYDKLDLANGTGEFEHKGIGFDALYFFDRSRAWSPYAVVGAGILRTEGVGSRGSSPMSTVGAGVMHRLSDSDLAVRADVRYRNDYNDRPVPTENYFSDWLINIGLTVPFGSRPAPAPSDSDGDGISDELDRCPGTPAGVSVDARGCEPDSDNDGVIDARDQCPDTRAGAKVDAQGCELIIDSDGDGVADKDDRCPNTPAGAKVDVKGCEADSDSDGIVDSRDQCPNTPLGTKVNAQGCEVVADSDGDGVNDRLDRCPESPKGSKVDAQGCEPDSDADGVADGRDQCPDTAAGTKIDAKGCPLREVINLKGVNFETGSAKLAAGSATVLDEMVDTLRRHPEIKVEIAGHTDNRGSASLNQRLSQARAESVRDYLVDHGIGADRLQAKGYGQAQPIADNTTADGRAENRRVELRILEGLK